MTPTDLLSTFDSLGRPRVLVVGDFILDLYTWGDAERISQEAPVVVLRSHEREARLGGAGNVCQMLRGLEAHVTCAGIVGNDAHGKLLGDLLLEAGVNTSGLLVDELRPTTSKERFMGRAHGRHPHQMLRVDHESREPLSPALEQRLADRLGSLINGHDIVLISDYDKGVCTPRLLRLLIDTATANGIRTVVDPIRGRDYTRYRGATTITPNRTEAGLATGIDIRTAADAFRAGRKLCRELKLESAIVTLDRDGMALVPADDRPPQAFPTQPRAVFDITGAGDMVLAMIGLCLAAGVSPADAVRLGNIAGGLEVEKVGVAVVPRSEIRERLLAERPVAGDKLLARQELVERLDAHRRAGRRIVFTNGCFDLLHVGHVSYLEEAAQWGDVLVVGINSDASVRRLKGPARPVISQHDRASVLAALSAVDYVAVFDEDTPRELIAQLRPHVLAKGGDYRPGDVVGADIVAQYGGEVRIAGFVDGVSSTKILDALGRGGNAPEPHILPAATVKTPAYRSKAG